VQKRLQRIGVTDWDSATPLVLKYFKLQNGVDVYELAKYKGFDEENEAQGLLRTITVRGLESDYMLHDPKEMAQYVAYETTDFSDVAPPPDWQWLTYH